MLAPISPAVALPFQLTMPASSSAPKKVAKAAAVQPTGLGTSGRRPSSRMPARPMMATAKMIADEKLPISGAKRIVMMATGEANVASDWSGGLAPSLYVIWIADKGRVAAMRCRQDALGSNE